ncbi:MULTISPECIES: hypothetical protein [unclassified Streptomyces]|uniref:hypothetical protein n=1 Tax=unclassified Streptomyces TaxID=2593676 RepID=UPI002E2D51AE|nr:hypothetical protein [Streptomyces sp. NBC_00223]
MNDAVTPPRSMDVTSVFPELAAHARTTVRLHPVPANPGPRESSVGGPPAWPENEAWPTCPGGRHPRHGPPHRPVNVRGERSTVFAYHGEITWDGIPPDTSWPLLPVLQVFARDVPWYDGFPEGMDVLQILWCPFQHFYDDPTVPYNGIAGPWVQIRYRNTGDLGDRFLTPPEPVAVGEPGYLPTPCLLRPEPVTEYPHPGVLGEEFEARVEEWEQATFADPEWPEDGEPRYSWDLSTAPGWKLGGHEPWNYHGYDGPVRCGTCGSAMRFVAAIASIEWDGGTESWAPVAFLEGSPTAQLRRQQATHVSLGKQETMRVFACPLSTDHPVISDLM